MVIRFEANVSNNYVRDKTEFYGEDLKGNVRFLKIFFFFFLFAEHGSLATSGDYKINLFYVRNYSLVTFFMLDYSCK